MTIVGKCSFGVTILFWQLVSLSVFAYSMAFLFWPEEANKLFVTALPVNTVRYIGSLYLFANAGLNQMVESSSGTERPMVKRMAFTSTILLYILSGASGLTVISLEDPVFTESQTMLLQVLYILFLSALVMGFCGICGGFCRVQTGAALDLESVEVTSARTSKPLSSTLSRDDIRNGRR